MNSNYNSFYLLYIIHFKVLCSFEVVFFKTCILEKIKKEIKSKNTDVKY